MKQFVRIGGRAPYEFWILKGLVHAGGRAEPRWVDDWVKEKMRDQFEDYEFAPLNSNGKPRWWNFVREARRDLVKPSDGRLKKTPPNVWEVSEKGRVWLGKNPDPPRLGRLARRGSQGPINAEEIG